MLSREEFIRISLEINMFFQRIMKEHLLFIETSLQPTESGLIAEANILKRSFEQLLAETVIYANGVVSESSIESNEFVTAYTLPAEETTMKLTGAGINTNITKAQLRMAGSQTKEGSEELESIVDSLNARSLNVLIEVIDFKKKLLEKALKCKIFISLYPEMLEHITEEAEYYGEILVSLQEGLLPENTLCDELNFWNNIMGEHAQFIDGLLDPTEKNLKKKAENFAQVFEKLVKECVEGAEKLILAKSLESTAGIQDYKRAAAAGLLECQIKSIIPPLLADHVFREANHYLRILKMLKE